MATIHYSKNDDDMSMTPLSGWPRRSAKPRFRKDNITPESTVKADPSALLRFCFTQTGKLTIQIRSD
jgi:hypothetical protein